MLLIVWDIDGTLVDGAGAGHRALERAVSAVLGHGVDLSGMDYRGRTDRALFEEALVRGGGRPTSEWALVREQYLRFLQEELPQSAGCALTGAESILARLQADPDVRQVLGTGNVEAGAWIKLGFYGLARFFATGGFGDHHRTRPPVIQEAAASAARHFESVFDAVVVVGDTPLDAEAARVLGFEAVGVATGHYTRATLLNHFPVVLENLSATESVVSTLRAVRRRP